MGEIIVGLLAVGIGLLFCLAGNVAMRVMFPFIGFFSGFSAGAGLVAQGSGDGFLSTAMGWIIGLCIGLLFALLAYFFYEAAIIIAFAGFGFAIASALLSVLNMDWNWLVIIAGTCLGIVFAIAAFFVQLPVLLLILATSFWGAAVAIYGLMLVFNAASLGDFSTGRAWIEIKNNIGLYLLWLFFGIAGGLSQTKLLVKEAAFTRAYWNKSKTFGDYTK